MSIDAHIGRRIRARRKLIGWTQARLAEPLGVTLQTVAKYETGQCRVTAAMLWEMCKALGTVPGYFYDGAP